MEKEEKMYRNEREKTRETHEEFSEEAKAAATRERAEYLVKEVKSNTQQIKNIMVHMQHVVQALAILKAQLQVVNEEKPASVIADAKHIETLKQNIVAHKKELSHMKEEIIAALEAEKKNDSGSYKKTEQRVGVLLKEVMEMLS